MSTNYYNRQRELIVKIAGGPNHTTQAIWPMPCPQIDPPIWCEESYETLTLLQFAEIINGCDSHTHMPGDWT